MDEPRRERFNAWPLLGAVLGVFGLVSYFALFAKYPALRDSAALNLILVAAGFAAAGWGLFRALRRGGLLRIAGAGAALLLAGACAGLLGIYVFSLSASLPAPTELTRSLEAAPDFRLTAQDGSTVGLSDYRGGKVLIVFYRGWW